MKPLLSSPLEVLAVFISAARTLELRATVRSDIHSRDRLQVAQSPKHFNQRTIVP
jgi:hypothetical protein